MRLSLSSLTAALAASLALASSAQAAPPSFDHLAGPLLPEVPVLTTAVCPGCTRAPLENLFLGIQLVRTQLPQPRSWRISCRGPQHRMLCRASRRSVIRSYRVSVAATPSIVTVGGGHRNFEI